jgi:hypothetical protein
MVKAMALRQPPPPPPTADEASALASRAFSLSLLALVPCCGVQLFPAGFALMFGQRARRYLVFRGVRGTAMTFANTALLLAGLVIASNVFLLGLVALGVSTGNDLRERVSWEQFDKQGLHAFRFRTGSGGQPFAKEPTEAETMPRRVAAAGEALKEQFDRARADAGENHVVVVMTSYDGCASCDEVWTTFDDPLLKHALPEVSVVRVDVEVFAVEMGELGMTRDAHPWFFLLDEKGKPVSAVGADAWAENVPINVAKGLRDWLDAIKAQEHPGTIQL